MMVTFVSQCEKNALKKTRRVLDAFADRIGDNTWQTVITEEGLGTVKKMLRQTASKSTAVSCHWIRSRSRSQLLWVVGNRSRFNEEGIVPVNYTNNQILIGEIAVKVDKLYANTKGQRLDQHLFAVAYLAHKIIVRLIPDDTNLATAVFLAGVWHDIGKIDPEFQNWLQGKLKKKKFDEVPDDGQHIDKKTGKFSWQKHPRHNEISLLLLHVLFDTSKYSEVYERINHTVYWHHAKPLRDKKNEISGVIGIYNKWADMEKSYAQTTSSVLAIVQSIRSIANEYFDEELLDLDMVRVPKFEGIEDRLEIEQLPKYKRYSGKENVGQYQNNIQFNALNNLARSALVTADQLISKSFTGESLDEAINSRSLDVILNKAFHKDRGLNLHIQQCLDGFRQNNPDVERNNQQSLAAKDLADKEVCIGVLRGPAGCGKTKVALEWALNTNARKIFWVCPRVQVCQGLFFDLTTNEYLPGAKVEICTGEIKEILSEEDPIETPEGQEFSGDVIITTIDQIINSITTHRNVTTLISFMDAHVVFDEFHEYISMPAFNLLFAELVEGKKKQQNDDNTYPNTLLVSATPNPLFIRKFLQLRDADVIAIPSFNQSKYRVDFVQYDETKEDDSNPLYQQQPSSTFVISNTAVTAQKSFIDQQQEENAILLHSKFKKSDREALFQKAFKSFKREGSRAYDILRSGPIVQASLNITCDKMVAEMSCAENFLQRMGRLDRFGQNDQMNQYQVAITEDVNRGKAKGASSRFLNQLNILQSAKGWAMFLQNALPNDAIVTISQMYDLYDRFYSDDASVALLEQDLIAALKESVTRINNNLIDPVTFPSFKKEENNIKIKKNSLRGDSRFVQMAVCKIEGSGHCDFLNEYAYPELEAEESLSYAIEPICGHGVSAQNLLSFMAKKHHNIKQAKKAYKDSQLLNAARNPETPIYLSYTPDDLKLVECAPHTYAIYYAIGENQPIGAITLRQLSQQGEE
ncbi:MAG: CRISPR-associated endonuclease Cas3'' [Desulfuromonadaceae bacterium]|nr:CRISPR-associated endonuclease Cas3'' [Desulfuromonadaceae bacterium]